MLRKHIQNVFTFISPLATFYKHVFQGFHSDKTAVSPVLILASDQNYEYDYVHTDAGFLCTPSRLYLLPAPAFASCRRKISCWAREHVHLQVNFLLKDSCENELRGDDWESRGDGGATQSPVFLTGNHHSLRLTDSRKTENERGDHSLESKLKWNNET